MKLKQITEKHRLTPNKCNNENSKLYKVPGGGGGGGGGGGCTWVFRGVHTFVIKIKKYP